MIEALCRSRPIWRQLFLNPLLTIVINPLHRVADEAKTELSDMGALHEEKRIDDPLVSVLTLIN